MLISRHLLETLLTPGATQELDDDALGEMLTSLGLELEGITWTGQGLETLVVGKIVSARPHPNADKLRLCEVDAGDGVKSVVCGAPNVPPPGGKIVFAPVGTRLPGGLEIGARKIRGTPSEGMICSEAELEIGPDADGIIVLEDDWKEGAALFECVPPLQDTIYELGVTPNRADALGHVGVARDLAVKLRCTLELPSVALPDVPDDASLVDLQAPQRCGRYFGFAFEGASVGAAPMWMRVALHNLGLRPINAVVDITNYVLLEHGQPLHIFDRNLLAQGRVVVRPARTGEPMTMLDGTQLELTAEDLVIADADKPQAPGGDHGRQGLGGGDALDRALPRGRVVSSGAHPPQRASPSAEHRLVVSLRARHRPRRRSAPGLRSRGGVDPRVHRRPSDRWTRGDRRASCPAHDRAASPPGHARSRARDPTRRCDENPSAGSRSRSTTPTPRPGTAPRPRTVSTSGIEEDLIEELLRHHGLDNLPMTPSIPTAPPPLSDDSAMLRDDRIVDALRSVGLREHVAFVFAGPEALAPFLEADPGRKPVALSNPMREKAGLLRTHMLPGLLDALSLNAARHARPVRLFEFGRVYAWEDGGEPADGPTAAIDRELPTERRRAAVLLGGRDARGDGREVAGLLLDALARAGYSADLAAASPERRVPWLHPGAQALVAVDGHTVGRFGEIHPDLLERFGVPAGSRAAYGELDVDALPAASAHAYTEVPRFPSTARDLSLEIPTDLPAADVVDALRRAEAEGVPDGDDPPRLASGERGNAAIEVIEDYRGEGIADGQRALLLRLHYRARARSITDAEVQARHEAVVETAMATLRPRAPKVRQR